MKGFCLLSMTTAALVAECGMIDKGCAATLTLAPSADACLFEFDPNNNLGGSTHLAAGTINTGHHTRALYRFDLSEIPTNATIENVTLTLRVVITPPGGAASTFGLHRMLQSWGEGVHVGNRGSLASASEVTWLSRAHGTASWSSPGGAIGSDFASTVSASTLVAGNGTYTFNTSNDLVRDVQTWVRAPAENHGWMLRSLSEGVKRSARRFASREDPPNAPVLLMQYSLPPARVTLSGAVRYYDGAQAVPGATVSLSGSQQGAVVTGNDGSFGFSVDPAGTYRLELVKATETPASQGATPTDIDLIRRQILGLGSLDSAYKVLGADVNNSKSLSTLDIVLIRRVLLSRADTYPGGSWKFVRSDFTFADPAAPWDSESARSVSAPASGVASLDFIGVKLGDVDASWRP